MSVRRWLRVPPYTKKQMGRVRWVLAPPRKRSPWLSRLLVLCVFAVLGALVAQVSALSLPLSLYLFLSASLYLSVRACVHVDVYNDCLFSYRGLDGSKSTYKNSNTLVLCGNFC